MATVIDFSARSKKAARTRARARLALDPGKCISPDCANRRDGKFRKCPDCRKKDNLNKKIAKMRRELEALVTAAELVGAFVEPPMPLPMTEKKGD